MLSSVEVPSYTRRYALSGRHSVGSAPVNVSDVKESVTPAAAEWMTYEHANAPRPSTGPNETLTLPVSAVKSCSPEQPVPGGDGGGGGGKPKGEANKLTKCASTSMFAVASFTLGHYGRGLS